MTNTPDPGHSPNTGDTWTLEAPTDEFGETREDRDRYPEDSNARKGETKAPSGQGGATPHDGTSYQDQFPPNPEPDEASKAWGAYLDAKRKDPNAKPPKLGAKPSDETVKPKRSDAKTNTGP